MIIDTPRACRQGMRATGGRARAVQVGGHRLDRIGSPRWACPASATRGAAGWSAAQPSTRLSSSVARRPVSGAIPMAHARDRRAGRQRSGPVGRCSTSFASSYARLIPFSVGSLDSAPRSRSYTSRCWPAAAVASAAGAGGRHSPSTLASSRSPLAARVEPVVVACSASRSSASRARSV